MSISLETYAARREALLARIGEGVVVIPSAPVFIRNNDVEHDYRQDSDFWYLTGFEEPESVLVLSNVHAEHRAVVFVRQRNPERETWDGPRAGTAGAVSDFGMDAAFDIDSLGEILPNYLVGAERLHYRVGRGHPFDESMFSALGAARTRTRRVGSRTPTEIVDTGEALHELRLFKEAEEIAAMQKAVDITAAAHIRAMDFAKPGMFEYQIDAELNHVFKRQGSPRVAYESIVGSGANATILHYRAKGRKIDDGDMLLIDAGCELDYYASDVTRTFPVGRAFTDPQRRLYEIVLEAQEASIAATKPGATLDHLHDETVKVLAAGLIREGLLQGSLDQVIEEGLYKDFYMHRTSHWIGMDVHDVGNYFVNGDARPLQPGMVLTIEPGLYVSKTAEVDKKWRGIGIRIEDNLVVTAAGASNLSAAIPKTVADIEKLTTS